VLLSACASSPEPDTAPSQTPPPAAGTAVVGSTPTVEIAPAAPAAPQEPTPPIDMQASSGVAQTKEPKTLEEAMAMLDELESQRRKKNGK